MSDVVLVSGGFDPIHTGHISMMGEASELGDELTVLLNNDVWLREKKGFVLVPLEEREGVIEALPFVDQVIPTFHNHDRVPGDMSICRELCDLDVDIFANGGGRKADNIPEYDICRQLGIEMEFEVGDEKTESSSDMFYSALRDLAESNIEF